MSAAEAGLHIPEGVPTNISGDPTEGKSCLCLITKKSLLQQIHLTLLNRTLYFPDYIYSSET